MQSPELYDSDTGESLETERVADLGVDADGEPMTLLLTRAKRGRIVQLRAGSLRVHYFVDEPSLDEDAARLGRWMSMPGQDAVTLIRNFADKQ